MQTLSIRDLRKVLDHLDALVNTSGEIVITRHGEAIARLLPIKGKRFRPSHEELHRLTEKLSYPSEKIVGDMHNDS
jgi:antitoxin (DNA-binding transcriptional repressor) of toxin-antitoxin stability system